MAGSPDHSAATEAAAHGGGGLPQFEFQHWAGQIFWLLLLFALLYVLMAEIFIPRLRRVIDQRRADIEGAIAKARQVQSEVEAQEKAAQQELSDARGAAQKLALESKAAANAETAAKRAAEDEALAVRMAEAELKIRAARDSAMANVSDVARDATRALVEKLSGAPASDAELAAAFAEIKPVGAA